MPITVRGRSVPLLPGLRARPPRALGAEGWGRFAPTFWKAGALTAAALVCLPIVMILLQWGSVGLGEQAIWQHLVATKLDRLLANTLILVVGVGIGVTLLGVSLAGLTALCDFPGRRWLDWALMLPLAIPGYVMAFVYLGLLTYAGPVQTAWRSWFGAQAWFPNVQGPGGIIAVLSLALFPYVYLLARAAFLAQGRHLMDAGRSLGLSARQSFLRVALPVARPAVMAGLALALMEALADFGAVAVFNYDTFTTAIYDAWYGLFNMAVAAQLASLLLLFVSLTLFLERRARRAAYGLDERKANREPYRLSGLRAWAASGYCLLVLVLGFALPLGQLLLWVLEAGRQEFDPRFVRFLGHTLSLGAIAALATVLIAVLLAFVRRLPGGAGARRLWAVCVRLATLGYALPGSVLAVGLLLAFALLDGTVVQTLQGWLGNPVRPVLVGSLLGLLMAYLTRFLAVAHAPVDAGLERIKPSLVDAGKSLGASPARLLRRVYLPLLRPGLFTALVIVFVDVMKEMPATLLLRPFGWETLAVRIYTMTAEGQWERAALPAVFLILAGLLPVILLVRASRAQSGEGRAPTPRS